LISYPHRKVLLFFLAGLYFFAEFFYWKKIINPYIEIEFYSIRKTMTQQEDFMHEAIALSAKNIEEKN
jgi:hypothetical protein